MAERDNRELRASERQFQREFGRMPCGMLALGLAGGWGPYLVANDAYCQLIGYTWEELAGHGVLDEVHPEDQPALEELIQALISGDSAGIAATTRLIHKDGGIIDARLTGSAIRPPAGEAYLAVFVEDITAAERAKSEAGQLGRELAVSRRLESVGHLVGGIAHDFNNLLTVIANYAGKGGPGAARAGDRQRGDERQGCHADGRTAQHQRGQHRRHEDRPAGCQDR
jgi:two-component system cell cycle sensor histidine kinase/response regulator CckA